MSLLVVCRKRIAIRPRSVFPIGLIALSVFLVHVLLPTGGQDQQGFEGHISPSAGGALEMAGERCDTVTRSGLEKGTALALTIILLWTASMLLFRSARPGEIVAGLASIVPTSYRKGSPAASLIALIGTSLIVFPLCLETLSAARAASRRRGGALSLRRPGPSLRNLSTFAGFALRRLYLGSDDILGRLSTRGYPGPDGWAKANRAKPYKASQIFLFAIATAGTAAFLTL
ncbi:hypothetical protein J7M28_02985 [bacterium]|nr:hypothetical protein [bacterium]